MPDAGGALDSVRAVTWQQAANPHRVAFAPPSRLFIRRPPVARSANIVSASAYV
jgi:hypothetical protein